MNAKKEFLKALSPELQLKCCIIGINKNYIDMNGNDVIEKVILKVGYSESDFETFLEKLDFDFKITDLFKKLLGIIWFENGEWKERVYKNGCEFWVMNEIPKIPKFLE